MVNKILMNSGASTSTIHDSFVSRDKFDTRKPSANKWSPELNVATPIFAPFFKTGKKSIYDIIFGCPLPW